MQIELTGKSEAIIQRLLSSGRYRSADEAVAAMVEKIARPEELGAAADTGPQRDRNALIQELRALRQEYIDSGGKLLTVEEVNAEVAARRGERNREE